MSYPINYPTPQGANIQIFNTPTQSGSSITNCSWTKPQGASFVWFTLIGGGAGGDGGAVGGGSGAVTNCMVPAFLIPDELVISVPLGGTAGNNGGQTSVKYLLKDGVSPYTLLTADGGVSGGSGGGAMTSNYFSAMGIFQSRAGQAGSAGAITASATTFLSGGGADIPTTANYGYKSNTNGFFQMQPIIVGVGGSNFSGSATPSGIGCGGGLASRGGNGLVVIITW
jgi:hypothetical protein